MRSPAWLYGLLAPVYDLACGVLLYEEPVLARRVCASASLTATREGREIVAARMLMAALAGGGLRHRHQLSLHPRRETVKAARVPGVRRGARGRDGKTLCMFVRGPRNHSTY